MLKPIPEFPDYFADELGNIFSMKPNNYSGGKIPTIPILLKPGKVRGYLQVALYKHGERFQKKVHFLILETYKGLCQEGMEACHNNGIRTDNRVENLRWDTKKNNHADKKLHGTWRGGEKQHCHKLNEMQVRIIRRYCEMRGYNAQRELARMFHVNSSTIGRIARRESWKHI